MIAAERAGICAIAVMAKAPREGAVKTRLVPPLDFASAARMSRAFLRDITENIRLAARFEPIHGYVAYAPVGVESLFDGCLAEETRLILADGAPESEAGVVGFGRCLLQTMRDLLAMGYGSAVVLNSDSPTLPNERLRETARLLARDDDHIVFGPADDGGYYLLGARAPHAHLFRDIAWSTDQVADQTRERAREASLRVTELASWYDVDDRRGLSRLTADLAGTAAPQSYAAPFTAAALAELRAGALLQQE